MKLLLTRCSALVLAAAALGLNACTTVDSGGGGGNYNVVARRPNNPAAVRVKVSIRNQAVYVTEGDRVLIHGGAGGVGSFAIQLCKALGCEVATTAGSAEKLEYCRGLGADILINYKEQNFADELKGSCDVILDVIGGPYLEDNITSLAIDGRLVVIALQGGAKGTLNLGRMLARRQSVHTTTLRARPVEMKADIVADTVKNVWPLLEDGSIKHNISRTFPLADAADAHEYLDSGDNTGKIVLTV